MSATEKMDEHKDDVKESQEHIEMMPSVGFGATSQLKKVSNYADVPRAKALRMFWRVALFSLMAAWTAIMDGYLVSSKSIYLMEVEPKLKCCLDI